MGDGGEVQDRGLFGGRHGHHRGEAEAYASEIGGDGYGHRRPEGVYAGGGEAEAYASEVGGGYGRPRPAAYEGEGGGYGGYAEEGYGRRPGVMYDAPGGQVSDLGTGLMDSNVRTEPGYGAGYGRSDLPGEYEERRHHGRHHGQEEDFEEERKHERYAEEAAAAAVGYGLYERHERKEDEERLEDLGYDEDGKKKHGHHLFRSDE